MQIHYASTFSYKEYQDLARQFAEQVDQQNYEPLAQRTQDAIQRLQRDWPVSDFCSYKYEDGIEKKVLTQEWPLWEHGGGGLIASDEVKTHPTPTQSEIGEWFLIVLAEHLGPCPSPFGNWVVIHDVLTILGWDPSNADLLFKGLPTYKLLKPNIMEKEPRRRTHSSPYWFWLHAGHSRSGWLPIEEIHRLDGQLRKMKNKVRKFDIRKLSRGFYNSYIDIHNPIVIRDYEQYLKAGYRDTLAMLSTALQQGTGLFMSLRLSGT